MVIRSCIQARTRPSNIVGTWSFKEMSRIFIIWDLKSPKLAPGQPIFGAGVGKFGVERSSAFPIGDYGAV